MKILKQSSKSKKFLALILAIVILLGVMIPGAAVNVGSKYSYTTSWLTGLPQYTTTGNGYGFMRKIVLKTSSSTSAPVYCIQHNTSLQTNKSGGGTAKATKIENADAYKKLSANAKEGIRLATIFGCKVTNNNYFYAATQAIIWEYELGLRTNVSSSLKTNCGSKLSSFVNGNKNIKECYEAIMTKIKNYAITYPVLKDKTYTLKGSGKANGITITDSNKAIQYFGMSNDCGLCADRSNGGNTLLLYMGKNASYPTDITVVCKRVNPYGEKAAVALEGAGQTLWYGFLDDPAYKAFTFHVSTNYGYGQIVKKNTSNSSDVSGFVFKIYNSSNTLVKTVKSNSNGTTGKFELPVGTYKVKETVGSKYKAVADQNITIKRATTTTITFTNSYKDVKFPVYLKKTMEGGDTSPQGCQFMLSGTDRNGNTVKITATADVNGNVVFQNVPVSNAGGYTVIETFGKDGYTPATPALRGIKVTDSGVQGKGASASTPLTFTNKRVNHDLVINKLNADTGASIPVAGFKFQVYNAETDEPVTLTYNDIETDVFVTDESGTIHIENVPEGKYYVKEIDCPNGYVLDTTPSDQKELGGSSGTTLITFDMKDVVQKGQLTLYKQGKMFTTVEENNGKYTPVYEDSYLSGAVFNITAAEDIYEAGDLMYEQGDLVDRVATGTDGKVVVDLPLGKYIVQEVEAPVGTVLDTNEYEVELISNNNTSEVFFETLTVTNENQILDIDFVKNLEKDEAFNIGFGEEYENVVFGLFADEEFTANDGSTIPEGGLIETASPDETGQVSFSVCVPEGSYYVQEMQTDSHYILNDTKFGLDYEYNDGAEQHNQVIIAEGQDVANDLIKGKIDGFKYDELQKPVQGAIIGLFPQGTTEFTEETAIVVALSNEKGEFGFEAVPYGEYIVREISAPEGYLINTSEWGVVIDKADEVKTVEILDQLVKGDLIITKVDDEDNFVDNVEFTIYKDVNENGKYDSDDPVYDYTHTPKEMISDKKILEKIFNNVVTSASQEIEDSELPSIEEIVRYIATGYAQYLETKEFPSEIDIDKDLLLELSFTKKELGIPSTEIANRIYQYLVWLYYQPESELTDATNYSAVGISKGKYLVQETKTPEDHVADTNVYAFEISENKDVVNISNTENGNFVNKIVRGNLKVTKLDKEAKKPLEGAQFTVYDSDGKIVATGNSNKDGVVLFENLRYGDYTVKETKAPEGYVKAEKPYKFSITEDGKTIEVLCLNAMIPITPEKNEKKEVVRQQDPNNPKTGENIALIVMVAISVVSTVSLAATLLLKKKGLLLAKKAVTMKTIHETCF